MQTFKRKLCGKKSCAIGCRVQRNGPELITSVDNLLFEAEDDGTEILIVGKVVPMFCSVKITLVRLLFHRSQFKCARTIKLLLDGRFTTGLQLVDFRQTRRTHLINNNKKQHFFVKNELVKTVVVQQKS